MSGQKEFERDPAGRQNFRRTGMDDHAGGGGSVTGGDKFWKSLDFNNTDSANSGGSQFRPVTQGWDFNADLRHHLQEDSAFQAVDLLPVYDDFDFTHIDSFRPK